MTSSEPPIAERFPGRADAWRLRTRVIPLPRRPLLMGIVNVTPDSFSDGGRFFEPQAAVDHALKLAAQGADILDVGGESTRPGAVPVVTEEELRRVVPVIAALRENLAVPISVDTSKAAVAREALAAGAQIINDVTALAGDPGMVALAVEAGPGVCVMHMRGTPRTMQDRPTYVDVLEEVLAWLRARRDALVAAGIDPQRIALDPGIGFGKTAEHNLTLLANVLRFHELGCPVVVGPSRKAFVGEVLGDPKADRTAGTIGVALALARQGVQIVRVHDVLGVREALALYEAAGGLDP
ncbi:MAG: dihydropteroate synthase [Pirellulales bacterium]